jgi:hypothetical protein
MIRPVLLEGYQDRVNSVADQVFEYYQNKPVSKDQLVSSIQARMHGVPLGSLKPKEFIQDVLAQLAGRMNLKKQPSETSKQLDLLAERMVDHVQLKISNQMPHVNIHDLPDLVYRRFKHDLEHIFWDSAASRKSGILEWFDRSVWPRVERAYKAHMGESILSSVASMYDQMVHDAAYDAAHKGLEVDQHLRSLGLSLTNPYKSS